MNSLYFSLVTPEERQEIEGLMAEVETLYHEGKLKEAEAKLRRTIEIDPFSPRSYHLLGTVLTERDEQVQALRVFEEGASKNPDNATLHYDLGFLYSGHGIISLAERELNQAIELEPTGKQAKKAGQTLEYLKTLPIVEPTPASDTNDEKSEPKPVPGNTETNLINPDSNTSEVSQ